MRLIDAEKLRDEVDDTLNWETNNEYNMYSDIMDMIDNASTIEAEPVRHGTWIEKRKKTLFEGLYEVSYDCSCCGNKVYGKYNYCSNCGAKMDLEG